MDLSKEFANGSNEPQWVNLVGDSRLYITRQNTPAFRKKLRKLKAPFESQIRTKTFTEQQDTEVMSRALAGTVLKGWENLKDEGEIIEFSEENAYKLLVKYEKFRLRVFELADSLEYSGVEESVDDVEAQENLKK